MKVATAQVPPSCSNHVFREYDIRGVVGRDFDRELAYRLGRTFAARIIDGGAPVVVGRDARLSGPMLQRALMDGLCAGGADVIDIGMVPTPLAYFAVFEWDAAGCIHVTASHNPSEYNGFKMMRGRQCLHGEAIRNLQHALSAPVPAAALRGGIRHADIVSAYLDRLAEDCPLKRPLKVAIDAGNGPAGLIAAPLYRRLGCEVIELHCTPDGRFPHHHPDPSVDENLRALVNTVRQRRCDLGIAFDGDGDRIGVVDARGRILRSDMLLLLLARSILEERPGATVIAETKCSQLLYDGIREAGGTAIMWKAGHSPIKAKMQECHAVLAGEMSGHIFFADRYFGFDDAIYAGARLMQLIDAAGHPLDELTDRLPQRCSTPEIRLPCPDEAKFHIVEDAIQHFRTLGYSIVDIDGMRLHTHDGWGLLRASNTQPALVLRFEAKDAAGLQRIRSLIEGWLERQSPMSAVHSKTA